MITLETERLILRNYTMNDVPNVHEYLSSKDVAQYEDFYPMTFEEVEEELTEWKDMDNRMPVQLKERYNAVCHSKKRMRYGELVKLKNLN